jgi:hypothetical protein
MFIIKNLNIEAKTLDSLKIYFNPIEHVYIKEFKYWSEASEYQTANLAKQSKRSYLQKSY